MRGPDILMGRVSSDPNAVLTRTLLSLYKGEFMDIFKLESGLDLNSIKSNSP